jgi:hypothetical protein
MLLSPSLQGQSPRRKARASRSQKFSSRSDHARFILLVLRLHQPVLRFHSPPASRCACLVRHRECSRIDAVSASLKPAFVRARLFLWSAVDHVLIKLRPHFLTRVLIAQTGAASAATMGAGFQRGGLRRRRGHGKFSGAHLCLRGDRRKRVGRSPRRTGVRWTTLF